MHVAPPPARSRPGGCAALPSGGRGAPAGTQALAPSPPGPSTHPQPSPGPGGSANAFEVPAELRLKRTPQALARTAALPPPIQNPLRRPGPRPSHPGITEGLVLRCPRASRKCLSLHGTSPASGRAVPLLSARLFSCRPRTPGWRGGSGLGARRMGSPLPGGGSRPGRGPVATASGGSGSRRPVSDSRAPAARSPGTWGGAGGR